MKLPSAKQLLEQSSATFKRFPFVIVNAVIGTVALIWSAELEFNVQNRWLDTIALTCSLGLPLFTTIAFVVERRSLSSAGKTAINLAAALSLALYGFSLPYDVFSAPTVHLVRFFLLNIGLHLLVSFAPFTATGEFNGFWQYNKSLFLRFLTASLFSFVLYLGLFVALQAVQHLFDLEIRGDRFAQLFFLVAGVFNTWFFLAGVPGNLTVLESDTHYPKGLKVFTQHILLPLVLIYLLILYAYELKIILQWDWPKGWVSNLILGFSITGILSLLLLWPIQEREENGWIRVFARRYYLALLPLVVMLVLAIWRRISEYGITENRYFVAVLGAWLLAMVAYFLLSKTKNIKIIPATLCAIAVLSSVGPWSAFSVSVSSQQGRLEELLKKANIAKPREERQTLPFAESKEISSIVRYLVSAHGMDAMQEHVPDSPLKDSLVGMPRMEQAKRILAFMGIPYIEEWEGPKGKNFAFTVNRRQLFPIGGYAFYIRSLFFDAGSKAREVKSGEIRLAIESDLDKQTLTIRSSSPDSGSATVNLGPFFARLTDEYGYAAREISLEKMAIEGIGRKMKWKVVVLSMKGDQQGGSATISSLEVDLLIGIGEAKPETGERGRENGDRRLEN